MLYICPICRKEFQAKPARQRRSKKVFCSPQCYYQSMVNTKRPIGICKKISLNHSRHNLGKKHSPELIKRMGKARKGKYCGNKHHMRNFPRFGKKAFNWKGGKIIRKNGEILIYCPNHQSLPKNKRHMVESRIIVEKIIRRYLAKNEVIHHIDFNKSNNSPANLYLFPSQSEHSKFHHLLRKNPNITLKSNLF